ncbi:Flavin-binding monooxygenase-like protein [Dictyocaulus viviparus]|uniref:Flavin-containing monooxygenase n=1 Tax=Dictyocaulus viviparus TaxID=29172 RepID=A0A0D8XXX4_DICVI|nr:Flavin-binding monooxygenase-like protein [Dictyocaulus viviparus]
MTAYSDFPPESKMANFMHNDEMYRNCFSTKVSYSIKYFRYLNLYANHFDLKKYIKFEHKVLQISRSNAYSKTGQWTVDYEDNRGNKHSEVFDGVLLCCGHHALPRLPSPWPGQERFQGRIIHSHSYRSHKGYEDKKVVIVGVGNSGGDLAVELSRIAKQTYLATRRGTWVCNRVFDYGEPFDLVLNRRFLEDLRQIAPEWLVNTVMENKLNKRFDHERYGLKPRHRLLSAHPTVNDELPNRIASGTLRIKPNIREFTTKGVIFEDGSEVDDVDEVLLATGYEFHFPMVEDGTLIPVHENVVELFQYMFPLETADHNSFAVIGLIQPIGSIMPISEMQARLFYENLFGTHKIPNKDTMKKSIREKQAAMNARYVKSPRHTIQVDYIAYMDELADLVGCKPNIKTLFFSDPVLALKIYFGPCVPYSYRLCGPHVWNEARDAIMNVDERVYQATNSSVHKISYRLFNGYLMTVIFAISLIILVFWRSIRFL